MEAILLTHDRQLGLAELVHKSYAELWPGHPFTFRIPFARAAGSAAFTYLSAQRNCRMIRSPPAIRGSMAALLDGLDRSEWVFWCIDDRFPIGLDRAGAEDIVGELSTVSQPVEEVKLLHWREPLVDDAMAIGGTAFRSQAPGSRARGFWHHHFVRAGVLHAAFLGEGVAPDAPIYAVNERIKASEQLVFGGTAQVPCRQLLSLGEPMIRGRLTRNGRMALKRMHCEAPSYKNVHQRVEFI